MAFAVFRADASVAIGVGHIMRCLTLADTMHRAGWRCAFACSLESLDVMPWLSQGPHEIEVIDSEHNEHNTLIQRWPDGVDLLVVDHYGLDHTFESACRPWAKRILVIDDLANRPHDCDVLLDQTLGRSEADYRAKVSATCKILTGPRYALLRPQFAETRPTALERRKNARGNVKRILVSLGGTDPGGVTERVLKAIAASCVKVTVDVVTGTGKSSEQHAVLEKLAHGSPMKIKVHSSVQDMATLMVEADIAIGAAGTTSWERCCLGLPTLMIVTADNQRMIADELEKAGAAINLGEWPDLQSQKITDAVKSICEKVTERERMVISASHICDGRGAMQVYLALLGGKCVRGGKLVTLRLLEPEDLDVIYRWQSVPDTRHFFLNPEIPSKDEHKVWFEQRINNASLFTSIICLDSTPSGILRLDPIPSETEAYEVSILVSQEYYRLGIGSAALHLLRSLFPGVSLHARIHPDNKASETLFLKSGYHRRGNVFINDLSGVE